MTNNRVYDIIHNAIMSSQMNEDVMAVKASLAKLPDEQRLILLMVACDLPLNLIKSYYKETTKSIYRKAKENFLKEIVDIYG